MNWSVIILGLVALSSVAIAENSYLVIVPKLLKVGWENQLSIFIAAASQPVEVKFELVINQKRIQGSMTCKQGETRNATLTLPSEFPVGAGELTITGTGGVHFEEKRDVIVYDNRHVILVQTSSSTYRPSDTLEVRVIATNEELIPMESGEVLIEIYDAALKLVGEFPRIPIRSGLTETLRFPIAEHVNVGTWLVSATIANTTSSMEVLVSVPVTPSFDLKAIFQRFLLRTDKKLRGIIEIANDNFEAVFGRATIYIGQITEQDVQTMMKEQQQQQLKQGQQSQQQPQGQNEEWRKWKSQEIELVGRVELNYDLLSLFNVDVTKALAVQVYIRAIELASGQERIIQHIVPVFTRDVIYDIRPLQFEAGVKNEFQVIAKRPDGKPVKMEDMIVTVTMISGNEQEKSHDEKSVEITDFYTRGRTDIGLFNIEIPAQTIGVLMTITPLGEDGKVRGYRTHAVPLMPKPRRTPTGAKLSIELLPSPTTPLKTDANAPVISTQISTVGRTSNFYVQLMPTKPVEKFEPLPMSYVLLTNGRITLTGEFTVQPTQECQTKAPRSIQPEGQAPPACVFNGTLPIQITRAMVPYSTLLVYTFQPSFGFNVAESYRFSIAGLFQSTLALNATIVPYTSTDSMAQDNTKMGSRDSSEEINLNSVPISSNAQDKTRVELSFTGTPDSTVGLNVIEYDGLIRGLSNDMTKERILRYLTTYEQVPIIGMPTGAPQSGEQSNLRPRAMGESSETVDHDLTTHMYDGYNGAEQHSESHETHDSFEATTNTMSDSKNNFRDNELLHSRKEKFASRGVVSEEQENKNIHRGKMGFKVRYPVEKMIFGIPSSHGSKSVEGDDVYTTSSMGRFYGENLNQRPSSYYRRRAMKSMNQYDVSVGDNDYVVATSVPLVLASAPQQPQQQQQQGNDDVEVGQQGETQESSRGQGPQYGTSSWYEKVHSKLSSISQEAFTFMQSGLSIVSDFQSLQVPTDMRRANLTKLFARFRQQSWMDTESFDIRDQARQLLEEYAVESDLSMVTPPIMLEEQARNGYYRSVFFNTSRIGSQGTGKVVLPQTKPYSTWLATGFALNSKSGLSVAQPVSLPTNQGLFILGNFPDQVQVGEHVLLTYGINNYLGKDLTNVIVRVRASADFDLIEQAQPERAVSGNGKDYTITIPSLKTLGVESRNIILVPKRAGVVKILLEVESEFGGDYEVLTTYVRESGIQRKVVSASLYDLTNDKKSYGPIVQKMTPSPFLRAVKFSVSGTGLDRLIQQHTMETNSLVGVDRAIIRLWRALGLRRYLNETSQTQSQLFEMTAQNVSTAFQKLQLYADYDGSYSFISDEGLERSSLYLSSLAFGALISPLMPVRDNVTLNRTLTWILSRQQQDGSFDDEGPCFHYRFCAGEYRREALTALVVYALTHDNVSQSVPQFIRQRLIQGEQNPLVRAHAYLQSRLEAIKPCLLTTTLVQLALVQCEFLPAPVRQSIQQNLLSRQLVVVPADGSKYIKTTDQKYTADDQLLLNALTLQMYAQFGDYKTTSEIARWIVSQFETLPYFDTVLDGVFLTEAWLKTDCLYRQRFGSEKFSLTVDVTADNGQKQQFKIDQTNMDVTQKFRFVMPVNQITYTVSGFGVVGVCIKQIYVENQQQTKEPTPFEVTNQLAPLPWFSEINAKTCLTYKPTARDQKLAKDNFNRTIIVEAQLPSGMRVNLRQLGFILSHVEEVMYFTYNERCHKIQFFINVPSSVYGKPICFDWVLERLSYVASWAPMQIRAYDYLEQDIQLARLFPVQLQPNLLGYSFIDAVHKARPNLATLTAAQQQQQQQTPATPLRASMSV